MSEKTPTIQSTLEKFAEKTNKLISEKCELFNISGEFAFTSNHFNLPDIFYKPYFENGLTPEQTIEQMELTN